MVIVFDLSTVTELKKRSEEKLSAMGGLLEVHLPPPFRSLYDLLARSACSASMYDWSRAGGGPCTFNRFTSRVLAPHIPEMEDELQLAISAIYSLQTPVSPPSSSRVQH